jgi:hypothetical protein
MIDGSASEPGPKRLNFSDERPVMPGSTRDEPVCWAANKLLCLTSLPLIFAAVDGLESELHGRRQPTLAETLNLTTYNSL